jgi:adenosine tuberculosinyltransferase
MNRESFRTLPRGQVARLLKNRQSQVAAIAVNGTRRWFVLEFGLLPEDHPQEYLDAMSQAHIRLCRLFFSQGVSTLVMPVFGPELAGRGKSYRSLAAGGLVHLASDPALLEFYRSEGVRVHCYGDYRAYFKDTPEAYLSDMLDGLAYQTAGHDRYRLFLGVCAENAIDRIIQLGAAHLQQHGQPPDKRTLVQLYYGDDVPPLAMFIGFDQFCMFDVPLLTTGYEDLYFTAAPSPYLNETQLRDILYDHLFTRRTSKDTANLGGLDVEAMRRFYAANRHRTLGLGIRYGGVWYPLPNVQMIDFASPPAEEKPQGQDHDQRPDSTLL